MRYTKGERVRLYSPHFGGISATVVQDQHASGDLVLLHVDGTGTFDHRWVKDSHVRKA